MDTCSIQNNSTFAPQNNNNNNNDNKQTPYDEMMQR